jgi:hypothetical protein
MSTTQPLQNYAADAAREFAVRTRRTPDETTSISVLKDSAPEWLRDAVRRAHVGHLPDDWKLRMASAACDALAEMESDTDLEALASEFADETDDTWALCLWLGSHTERPGYCDEAAEEWGTPATTMDRIRQGQAVERREVFGVMRAAIQAECMDIVTV